MTRTCPLSQKELRAGLHYVQKTECEVVHLTGEESLKAGKQLRNLCGDGRHSDCERVRPAAWKFTGKSIGEGNRDLTAVLDQE